MARLFSHVVEHDEGRSPNPYGRYCTLCHCKFSSTGKKPNVVELASKGDWVVGTGGANLRKSSGHGTIVYAMKVTDKLPLREYLSAGKFRSGRIRVRSQRLTFIRTAELIRELSFPFPL
jgi:hypothetical protein